MHPMHVRATTKMRILRVVCTRTGTYNPMFARPFITNVDGHTLGIVVDRALNSGTGKLTGAALAGATTGILTPNPTAGAEIQIGGGWNESRIRFFMEVECQSSLGTTSIYYLQGYTSYPGISDSGAIDPQMEFIFNSFVSVSRVMQPTPAGYVTRDIVSNSGQIINNHNWAGMFSNSQYLMRPQDIFTGMHSAYVQNLGNASTLGQVTDARAQFRGNVECNRRSNNVPSNYLGTVIDSFYHSTVNSSYGDTDIAVLDAAQQFVQDPRANEIPLLAALSERYGRGITNRFTWGDLLSVDPGAAQNLVFIRHDANMMSQVHTAGSTSYWNGANYHTQVASILAAAIPALMFDCMLTRLAFRSTNSNFGQVITIVSGAEGFTSIESHQLAEMFVRRFESEVARDISYNNQEQFDISVMCNLYGETIIDISMAGQPSERFTVPSFCDNLFAPILAPDAAAFGNIVHDLDVVVNQVTEAVAGNTMSSPVVHSLI